MLDVLHAGAVVSGVSPAYNIEETTYALTAANPQFLIILSSSMNVAAAAAKNAGIPQERVSPP
jgi:4-coumarate--CoA ligase